MGDIKMSARERNRLEMLSRVKKDALITPGRTASSAPYLFFPTVRRDNPGAPFPACLCRCGAGMVVAAGV